MSIVDRRVVDMELNSSEFNRDAEETTRSLEKLQNGLSKLGDNRASDGLLAIRNAIGKVDFSGLSYAVEEVGMKFTAMEVVAATALMNITNRAVDAGIRIAKSLSVDNIGSGWSKYADISTSTGTLIAQGYAMEEVNEQLDRLLFFTDETSYTFTDMVSNIGKFTASGVGLEDAVTAMEGIANWAALSGQNAATASRAMYQLSQAMSAGVMRKEDYKSIQTANMDTSEFRQKALDAAVALGTLQKEADGTFSALNKNGKKVNFTMSQMVDNLTETGWFTSEVMMNVFADYGGAVQDIFEYVEEHGGTASDAIEAMSGQLDDFQLKAFRSAQEARTFRDAIDSVKEAVASGWMKSFQIIFGDYEQAKTLWTDLANSLWDVFAAGGEVRNEILELWKEAGGGERLFEGFWSLWEGFENVRDIIKEFVGYLIPFFEEDSYVVNMANVLVKASTALQNAFNSFGSATSRFHDWLFGKKETQKFQQVIAVADDGTDIFEEVDAEIVLVQAHIDQLLDPLRKVKDYFLDFKDAVHNFLYEDILTLTVDDIPDIWEWALPENANLFETTPRITVWIDNLKKSLSGLKEFGVRFFDDTIGFFVDIYNILSGNNIEAPTFDSIVEFLRDFKLEAPPLFDIVSDIYDVVSKIFEPVKNVIDTLFDGEGILTVYEQILGGLEKAISGVKTVWDDLTPIVVAFVDAIRPIGEGVLGAVVGFFEDLFKIPNDDGLTFYDKLGAALTTIGEGFSNLFDTLSPVWDFFVGVLDSIVGFGSWFVQNGIIEIFSTIGSGLAKLGDGFASMVVGKEGFNMLESLTGIAGMYGIYYMLDWLRFALESILDLIAMNPLAKLSEVLTSVEDVFGSLSDNLWSGAVKNFAVSMLIMSGALLILSLIDTSKALVAIGVIEVIMRSWRGLLENVFASDGIISNLSKFGRSSSTMAAMSGFILSLSASILILAIACKMLSSINPINLVLSIAAVTFLIHELTKVFEKMTLNMVGIVKGSGILVAMASAVLILAVAMKILASIDIGKMVITALVVAVLITVLSDALLQLNNVVIPVRTTLGIIAIAAALTILLGAVALMSLLKPEKMVQGLAGVITLLAAIVAFAKNLNIESAGKVAAVSASMILLGTALLLFAGSVRMLAKLSPEQFVTGMLGFLTIMLSIGLLVDYISGKEGHFLAVGAGMLFLGTAMLIIAGALRMMSSLNLINLLVDLGVLVALLYVTGDVLNSVKSGSRALSTAVALLIVSSAVVVLAGAMMILSSLNPISLVVGLIAMAGVIGLLFVSIAAIAGLSGAFGPALLGVAVYMLAIGAACALLAIGVAALGAAAGGAGTAIATFLSSLAGTIRNALPALFDLISAICEGVVQLLVVLGTNIAPIIAQAVIFITQVLTALGTAMIENAEALAIAGGEIVAALAIILFGALVNGIGLLWNKFKPWFEEKWPEIKEWFFGLLGKIGEWIAEKWEMMKQWGRDVIEQFKQGWDETVESIKTKIHELVDNIKNWFKEKWDSLKETGKNIMDGLSEGMASSYSDIKRNVGNWASGIKQGFDDFFQIESPSRVMMQTGRYIDEGLAIGIADNSKLAVASAESMSQNTYDAMADALANVQALLNEDGSLNPTITPVLDLEDVRNGVGSINSMFSQRQALAASISANANVNAESMDTLIELGRAMLAAIQDGGDVYLNENVLVGRINRRLGRA